MLALCLVGVLALTLSIPLRVMTYNIHHGAGMDDVIDLERIAAVIRDESPHLVALQELDVGVERSGCADQVREMARLTGMEARFGRAIDYKGGEYGVAILSTLPILAFQNRALPGSPEREARTLLTVEVPWQGERLEFASTHFDHRSAADRQAQAEQVAAWLKPGQTTVIAGDLNAEAQDETLSALMPRLLDAGAGAGPTFTTLEPTVRIDYILAFPPSRWRVVESWVVRNDVTKIASDHLPVMALLELEGN